MQCLQHFLSLDAYLLTHYTDYSTVVIFPLDFTRFNTKHYQTLIPLTYHLYACLPRYPYYVPKQAEGFLLGVASMSRTMSS